VKRNVFRHANEMSRAKRDFPVKKNEK